MSVSAPAGIGTAAMISRDQMAAMLAARPAVANQGQQVAAVAQTGTPAVSTEGSSVDLFM